MPVVDGMMIGGRYSSLSGLAVRDEARTQAPIAPKIADLHSREREPVVPPPSRQFEKRCNFGTFAVVAFLIIRRQDGTQLKYWSRVPCGALVLLVDNCCAADPRLPKALASGFEWNQIACRRKIVESTAQQIVMNYPRAQGGDTRAVMDSKVPEERKEKQNQASASSAESYPTPPVAHPRSPTATGSKPSKDPTSPTLCHFLTSHLLTSPHQKRGTTSFHWPFKASFSAISQALDLAHTEIIPKFHYEDDVVGEAFPSPSHSCVMVGK